MVKNKEVVQRVEKIYKWLDEQLVAEFICDACGKCCDFESFGHRLYVTSPEMLFFTDKVSGGNIKQMTGRCPWQIDDKCAVYPYRFASCRIFCCKGDSAFQNQITETAVRKFKKLCNDFRIPYQYVDLPTALKEFFVSTCQSAGKSSGGGLAG